MLKNFLNILLQWTRTFPYDFRDSKMMSQLENTLDKINFYESTLQSITYIVKRKLFSKVNRIQE